MDRILSFLIHIVVFISGFPKLLSRFGIGSYDEWAPGKPLRVLLVGYNGARNTGSDARVVAIARQVKEVFSDHDVRITVLTLSRSSLDGYFDDDVELHELSSIFLWDLMRVCSENHAAILSEGSTLKSKFANGLTLFQCEAAGVMSRQKKPCIAYGSEVGGMEPFLEKAAVHLCRDTYFIARTRRSLDALEKLGLKGHLGTDTAWCYDKAISPAKAGQYLKDQGWDGHTPLLGVAVIDPFIWPVRASLLKWIRCAVSGDHTGQYDKWFFFSDSPERRRAYDRYISAVAGAIRRYSEETDLFPVILGMEKLDERPCRDLQAKLERPCAFFPSGEWSADIMTGILRRLSVLITSRYHASVLSMDEGIPVIAVSMDERLDSIMEEVSLDENYLHHVTDADLEDRICRSLILSGQERAEIRSGIERQRRIYETRLNDMGAFLRTYVGGHLS